MRHRITYNLFLLVALATCAFGHLTCVADEAPRAAQLPTSVHSGITSPVDSQLVSRLCKGKFSGRSLFRTVATADGIHGDSEVRRYEQMVIGWAAQAAQRIDATAPLVQKAQQTYDYLYRQILTGSYHSNCSIRETIRTGDYNCVTATLLYCCLCERQNIDLSFMATPGHVYCQLSEESLDIQTTCPSWSDAVNSRAMVAADPGQGKNPATRVELRQFVAKVYYNRALRHLHQEQFPVAIALLSLARNLDATDDAILRNLAAGLNNWGLERSEAGDHPAASELVRCGLTLHPSFEPLRSNMIHVHNQWVRELCSHRKFEEALALLRKIDTQDGTSSFFHKCRLGIYHRWAVALLKEGDAERAKAVLQEARHVMKQQST